MDKDLIVYILILSTVCFFVFAGVFGITWFKAVQEAKSYRKFCDKEVTTWDALWLDLRIDECK